MRSIFIEARVASAWAPFVASIRSYSNHDVTRG